MRLVRDADRLRVVALKRDGCGVMQDQNRVGRCMKPFPGGMEVSIQNRPFADVIVGKEAIRRLGVSPVLSGQRNALAEIVPELRRQFAETSCQPRVMEPEAIQFLRQPRRQRPVIQTLPLFHSDVLFGQNMIPAAYETQRLL